VVKTTTVAAAGAVAAIDVNYWVSILSGIYVVGNIGLLIPKYWRLIKRWLECRHGDNT
jgi:hypothetical protein